MQDSWFHTLTIVIHVVCGTVALGVGLVQLWSPKGGPRHVRLGQLFVALSSIVVATAALGLILFRFRAFLAVLTLLVAYWIYSGVRAIRHRRAGPGVQDAIVSLAALAAVAIVMYFLPRIRTPWVPAITYSTLGTLASVASYDLSRFLFPRRWLESLWLYEHIVKMIGAHAAIVAAFSGTVLSSWQPFSQIAPSVIWTALQVGFVIHAVRRRQAIVAGDAARRIA